MRLRLALPLALAFLVSGCLWHGRSGDQAWGPALIRTAAGDGPVPGRVQTVHFPLLLEGGRQWGLSLGYVNRLVVTPTAVGEAVALEERWHPVWGLRRLPKREGDATFRRRIMGGLYLLAGRELRAAGLGLLVRNDTLPGRDGFYELDFDSRRPFATRFTFEPPGSGRPFSDTQPTRPTP